MHLGSFALKQLPPIAVICFFYRLNLSKLVMYETYFIDIMMPELDGYHLFEIIRKEDIAGFGPATVMVVEQFRQLEKNECIDFSRHTGGAFLFTSSFIFHPVQCLIM